MDSVVGLGGREELFVLLGLRVLIPAHTTRSVWHEEPSELWDGKDVL
jgi:hypothetical protein